jgi:hypothetical protein
MFAPKIPKPPTKTAASSLVRPRSRLAAQRHSPAEQAVFLQRTIGNQATLRLLARQTSRPAVSNPPGDFEQEGGDTKNAMAPETSRGASWDFSKIPLFPRDQASRSRGSFPQPGIVQRKLVVGQASDPVEREADHAADQVMRMPDLAFSLVHGGSPLGRKSAACEIDQKNLQMKPVEVAEPAADEAPPIVHEVMRSSGQPLDAATRAYFEPRFGHGFSGVRAEQRLGEDFSLSHVRVHTDAAAARSAFDVNARAYTVGSHIVFGAGESPSDRSLLAHELAHVAQQANAQPVLRRQPKPGADERAPGQTSYPQWAPADAVVEIRWLKADDWQIDLSGRTTVKSARALLWPKWMPSTVTMTLEAAIIDPIESGRFTISGLQAFHLEYMEPSIAALFRDRGLVDEPAVDPDVAKARDAFRKHNSDLGEWMLSAIHVALKRATKGNADLMLAFYRYYSSHDLERKDMKGFGETSSGDTQISSRVLMLELDPKHTNAPISLLGGTLIHEFVHTPQGPKELGGSVTQLTKEAKAYAIELLFSERMGDATKAADIEKQWLSNDSLIVGMGADKVFNRTYRIISKLYEIIDSKGGAEAAAARKMSVEFISRNEADYGPELRDFIRAL